VKRRIIVTNSSVKIVIKNINIRGGCGLTTEKESVYPQNILKVLKISSFVLKPRCPK
tara:strand:+ start:145 stop:315 length:171 start_codon:yes stop_codon:yes gene_type:complete